MGSLDPRLHAALWEQLDDRRRVMERGARRVGWKMRIVAANVFHRAVAFGPRQRALPEVEGRLIVDGEERCRAPARRDQAEVARQAAHLLEAVGERLRPGDLLITGSVVQTAVRPGERVVADLGALGRVEATIARAT